jgi:hypothetical protein
LSSEEVERFIAKKSWGSEEKVYDSKGEGKGMHWQTLKRKLTTNAKELKKKEKRFLLQRWLEQEEVCLLKVFGVCPYIHLPACLSNVYAFVWCRLASFGIVWNRSESSGVDWLRLSSPSPDPIPCQYSPLPFLPSKENAKEETEAPEGENSSKKPIKPPKSPKKKPNPSPKSTHMSPKSMKEALEERGREAEREAEKGRVRTISNIPSQSSASSPSSSTQTSPKLQSKRLKKER